MAGARTLNTTITIDRAPDLVNFDTVGLNGHRGTALIRPASVATITAAPDGHSDIILNSGDAIRVVEGPHDAAELLGLGVTGSLARFASPAARHEARIRRIRDAHPLWSDSECEQFLADQTDEHAGEDPR
jgi:hypothetical protein